MHLESLLVGHYVPLLTRCCSLVSISNMLLIGKCTLAMLMKGFTEDGNSLTALNRSTSSFAIVILLTLLHVSYFIC